MTSDQNMISASKYHSDGNDFLILSSKQLKEEDYLDLARSMCCRHRGVGADGCVFVAGPSQGQFSLRIFNRDGSEAAMSGNGARCACAFLHHTRRTRDVEVKLETRSGIKVYQLLEQGDSLWQYRCTMGCPRFLPSDIPFRAEEELETVEEYPLAVDGEVVRVTALSVGNPQCVIFVDELPGKPFFERAGAALEVHSSFPERTNVSFVKVENSHQLRVMIWERGVGPTHSSGTGSCGAAVAAIRAGRVQSPVKVHTAGGAQKVEWASGEEMTLTGRAQFVSHSQFYWSPGA